MSEERDALSSELARIRNVIEGNNGSTGIRDRQTRMEGDLKNLRATVDLRMDRVEEKIDQNRTELLAKVDELKKQPVPPWKDPVLAAWGFLLLLAALIVLQGMGVDLPGLINATRGG